MLIPLNGYKVTETFLCPLALIGGRASELHILTPGSTSDLKTDVGLYIHDVAFSDRTSAVIIACGRNGIFEYTVERGRFRPTISEAPLAANSRLRPRIITKAVGLRDANGFLVQARDPAFKTVSIWQYDDTNGNCECMHDGFNISLSLCRDGSCAVEYRTRDAGVVRLWNFAKNECRMCKLAERLILHARVFGGEERIGFSTIEIDGSHLFHEYLSETEVVRPLCRGTVGDWCRANGRWAVTRGDQELLVSTENGDEMLAIGAAVRDVCPESELNTVSGVTPKWSADGRWILATLRQRNKKDVMEEKFNNVYTVIVDTLLRTISPLSRSFERICWGPRL